MLILVLSAVLFVVGVEVESEEEVEAGEGEADEVVFFLLNANFFLGAIALCNWVNWLERESICCK